MVYIACYYCGNIYSCRSSPAKSQVDCRKCNLNGELDAKCRFNGLDGMEIGLKEEIEYKGSCEKCQDEMIENILNRECR